MGHNIRAFIGKNDVIEKLASNWLAKVILLKQGYSMVFLTDRLFDDITELSDLDNEEDCLELDFFTTAISEIMKEYSYKSMLAYVETDYFGGTGTQAGVLFKNGNIIVKPAKEENIINIILHKLGVYREKGKDEFDSINLGEYRKIL